MAGFSVYPRKRTNGKPVFYVQFKQSDGTYGTAKSTGQSSRRAAEAWSEDFLRMDGPIMPGHHYSLPTRRGPNHDNPFK